MKKNRRIFSGLIASVLTFSLLGTSAFASGTVTGTSGGYGSSTYIEYSFDADGNSYSTSDDGAHHGKTSVDGFAVSSAGSYRISYDGASSTGANVYIFSEASNALICNFNIPVYQSGMPTLNYYADLSAGQYYVKVVSSSNNTYSTGRFRVNGISGTYRHNL